MKLSKPISILLCSLCCLSFSAYAELQDQGLNSIMLIIDKAIDDVSKVDDTASDLSAEELATQLDNASATIVNLSRTLGTLSYSRLQCGEAGVLAEFTQRVQLMPEERRDAMRTAFQAGFDKSKSDSPLLSEDECKRLTESRNRDDTAEQANVAAEDKPQQAAPSEEVVEEKPAEDPKMSLLRIAEISGQLAYKRKFCDDGKVFNRDYNEYLSSVPEEYQEEVKTAYWKGFKHGKRLNKNLKKSQCN
ncbi:MAG: hypothetical protein GY784_11200 [Gammaproteobacteria bacterium]|nr:hypothetical protein [Gammaproteobacteria bacterium]